MFTHQTKDGRVIPIASLDLSHLNNIINLYSKQLLEQRNIIDGITDLNYTRSQQIALGITVNKEQRINKAEQKFKKLYVNVAPYIMELAIRGQYSSVFQEAIGRSEQIKFSETLQLSVRNTEYDDDYDYQMGDLDDNWGDRD